MAVRDTTRTNFTSRTEWARSLQTPLREFLRTETGSGAFLLGAALIALIWANVDASSYETVWRATLSIGVGGWNISQDLRHWVNNGLMTFFFFVVGLEARRELDLGELRQRRRIALPLAAGLGGMAAAAGVFLAANSGRPSASGWGVAMSTDTAFALSVLALVGARYAQRTRAFLLTVVVVDDVISLIVIATVYSSNIRLLPLGVAFGVLLVVLGIRALRVRYGLAYAALGTIMWIALFDSGVDPLVVGLVMGLLAYAYPAARPDLLHATDVFRRFREQPTPELERSARTALRTAISPNERLQELYHPWTSYVFVPLFALANAGIVVDGGLLGRAAASPVTLGIIAGYVLGKPLGVLIVSSIVTVVSRGRLRPPVGWAAVLGSGTAAGVPFTVSLLIADLAFTGVVLEEAKLGILGAAVGAGLVTWALTHALRALPRRMRLRALLGKSEQLEDLAVPVEGERDHFRGPADAPVTLLEYGDFECPYCGQAEPVIRELLRDFGDVRYVWRHLPLTDVHSHAQIAAEAAEAAAGQGAFWEMHDILLQHQDALRLSDLLGYADELGLDLDRFAADLREHRGEARVAEDVESADLSGVSGTPTFFINGRRHYGAYDIMTLKHAVKTAAARQSIAA